MGQTVLSGEIDAAGQKAAYDSSAKRLLSSVPVLACMMGGLLREFSGLDLEACAALILGPPAVASEPLHAASGAAGVPLEDPGGAEGRVTYDVRFDAAFPDGGDSVGVEVNIEAQRPQGERGARWLVRRGIYHCARMISSQRGRLFTGMDYQRVAKACSVWVVTDGVGRGPGSVARYALAADPPCGPHVARRVDYDVIEVIVAHLGSPDESRGVLRMLATLLSATMAPCEKKRVLENEYHMAMTDEMECEVERMCNISESIEQRGIEQGIEQGVARALARMADKLGMTLTEAMDVLEIPEGERAAYAALAGAG